MGVLSKLRGRRRLGHSRYYEVFIAPLSRRERFIYGSLITAILLAIIIPRVSADISNVGTLMYVPSQQCVTVTSGWSHPELAIGLPNIGLDGSPDQLTPENSATNFDVAGQLICNQFTNTTDVRRASALDISMALRPSSDTEYTGNTTPQANSQPTEPTRVDKRVEPVSPNRFNDKNTSDLDGLIRLSVSKDNGKTWQVLHVFGPELLNSTTVHQAVFLPDKYNADLANLAVMVEYLVGGNGNMRLLIDSINVSYKVGRKQQLELRTIKPERAGELSVLSNTEDAQFRLRSKPIGSGFTQGVTKVITQTVSSSSQPEPSISVRSNAINSTTQAVIPINAKLSWKSYDIDNNANWDVKVDLPRSASPGRYTLNMEVTSDNGAVQVLTQDFLWGVLAINPDKAEYQIGDTANFAFGVLDEKGKTVCDAALTLEISNNGTLIDKLSSADGTISLTDSCRQYGNQTLPDYVGAYKFDNPGAYELHLIAETNNGNYDITDSIRVVDKSDYIVARSGPTRIYPAANYTMTLNVTASADFVGSITELVPASFKISQSVFKADFSQTKIDDQTLRLSWALNLQAGQSVTLGYVFDAPDISPEFYTLGPAKINDKSGQIVFDETRQWMIASDAIGRMILFYDGASVPAGWTCVSCQATDPFYQRLVRGSSTYGTTGGSATHTHTASATVYPTGSAATVILNTGKSDLADNNHSHTLTPIISAASNLPNYRQLKLIRNDAGGEPATLPAGVIAIFDATVPSGWTRYSAQDGYYIYGENTVGTTGGSNTHSHTITGTTSGSSSPTPLKKRGGGSQTSGANEGHTHSISSSTGTVNNEPPHISVILGKLNAAAAPPGNMLAMWDDTIPGNWTGVSNASQPFNQKFIVGSASYGTTGGTSTHSHADVTGITSSSPIGISTSRIGSTGSSSSHTHQVDVTGFSTDSHLPPYIEAIIAKKNQGALEDQSAYRLFNNTDSTDVGTPLAAQDTAATTPTQNTPFRLRMNIHISNSQLALNGNNYKLQYSLKSGSCDSNFIGESYSDVGTTGAIHYYNNSTPSDGSALTTNANDPVHGTDTTQAQTYEESNNFTNSQSVINAGEDGMWDFALVDESAPENTSYCFRIVHSDNSQLDTYGVIPEITTPNQDGHLILFYDGASAPAGWTCISCTAGDDAYQRFLRGEASYGGTGGALTHTHTASATVNASTDAGVTTSNTGSDLATATHIHNLIPTVGPASNLPPYRQLLIIKADVVGEPTSLPAGVIAMFNGSVPSGWTQYSAQNGNYVLGEATAGTTGGSLTHNHSVSGTTTNVTSTTLSRRSGGTQVNSATATHNHTISGTTDSQSNEPPYREAVFGKLNSAGSVPNNMVGFWDDVLPAGWTNLSTSGQPYYQRFVKAAATAGGTGGSATHGHGADVFVSSAPDAFLSTRSGTTGANDTHTHNIDVTYSVESNLPPYLNAIVAKKGVNQSPNTPTSLAQKKTDLSTLGVGDWTDETSVVFSGSVSDPDNPDTLELCVEVQPITSSFTNSDTACGTGVSYTGSAVTASVTIGGLANTTEYHWQARTRDQSGEYSAWISFGGNAENARDVGIDTVAPTGAVYDGLSVGVDIDYNNGSLSTLSANWNITDATSGINQFEYSIGTAPGATDIKTWTNVALTTSVTANSLTLNTSQPYYFNIRATDNAGNQSVGSSDGQFVAPTLSFGTAPAAVTFANLNAGNNYTDTKSTTLTTSTNAYNGYIIRAYADALLTSTGGDTIVMFNGGTYAAPDEWLPGDTGYGFTSNDTTIQGVNIFGSTPCAGGGNPPCYAPFSLTAPGDIVADHTAIISGSPVTNENFIITHRVTVDAAQPAGTYNTQIIYSISARY